MSVHSAFVALEEEGMKVPANSTIGSIAHQRSKNRILSGHKPYAWTQHVGAWETAAKKSSLPDLPRSS